MDRLSVGLAISRGRRLYHGLPFVVFALDLRDPLGLSLTYMLHVMGDARSVADVQRRADRFDRAPVAVVASSLERALELMGHLDSMPHLATREGCTAGDIEAVRSFIRGAQASKGDVCVFLAADDERSVYRFPLHRRGLPKPVLPMDPLLFGLVGAGGEAANANERDRDDAGSVEHDGGLGRPAHGPDGAPLEDD
jgi:hypothetical protein